MQKKSIYHVHLIFQFLDEKSKNALRMTNNVLWERVEELDPRSHIRIHIKIELNVGSSRISRYFDISFSQKWLNWISNSQGRL